MARAIEPRSILITGASSGIGAALAHCYAGPGTTLALCGRDAARLETVAAAARGCGAAVTAAVVDVTDAAATMGWIDAADAAAPLDLVIANAGIADRRLEAAATVMAINVGGVVNTVQASVARMRPRGRGQIAVMSSLAGFRGYPGAAAYCASKAAVRSLGEALRAELAPVGIRVSVICPGFVTTPMIDGSRFPTPFAMSAGRAAGIIRRGLARDRGRIAFPLPLYALTWLFAALPDGLADFLVGLRRSRAG